MIHLFFHSPLLQQIYNAFNLQQSLSSVFKCLICCRVQLQFSLCRRFNSLPCVCPIACLLGWRDPTAPDPSERGRGREANRRAETSQCRCPSKHLGALGDYLLCSHHSQQAAVEQGFPPCQEQALGWLEQACSAWAMLPALARSLLQPTARQEVGMVSPNLTGLFPSAQTRSDPSKAAQAEPVPRSPHPSPGSP